MRTKTQSPWGRYDTDLVDNYRARVVFTPIAKGAGKEFSMPMERALAQEKAELWAAEDWYDYGNGSKGPKKRREFVELTTSE